MSILDVKLLQVDGCPTAPKVLDRLRTLLAGESVQADIEVITVRDENDAIRHRFMGSPSIIINGYDIEIERRHDKPAFGCRIYETMNGPSGMPEDSLITDAIRRAANPSLKVLFLCTGNSCRSQMAEGWTRFLKGDMIDAASAGIETHGLNPRAVAVMAEAGLDISGHRSENVNDMLHIPFDYVITLCGHAFENCPYFPGKAKVLHVGFDDPPKLAADAATVKEALSHYRRVRDEIRTFVETLPGGLFSREQADE